MPFCEPSKARAQRLSWSLVVATYDNTFGASFDIA